MRMFRTEVGIINNNLTIRCSICGPVRWQKDGHPLPYHYSPVMKSSHMRITFKFVMKSDAGKYKCYKKQGIFSRKKQEDVIEVIIASM